MAVFLYIAYGILILTPFMVIWTVFVFRKLKPYSLFKQAMIYLTCGIISALLAWTSLMSNNEIFIFTLLVLNGLLLIINTTKGVINLKHGR